MQTNMTAFISVRRKRGPMNAAKKTISSLMKQLEGERERESIMINHQQFEQGYPWQVNNN
jgi:hypothetical protein